MLGSVTFGAEAARDSIYAVLHRFPAATDARTAIADTLGSWRFPRQVRTGRDLKPGSWLVTEVDGSLALHISAQLGYDFNMVREAKLLGMTRNLGAKIDTALKTTFGFDVSGRYLLVLGRESADDSSIAVRLQLFKRSQKGLSFGLNLSVGVTGQNDLPTDIDELVKAVFGVHGLQAMKDLHLIEQWTDPATDLGQTAERLLNDTGLKLLTEATGIDAAKEFTKARQIVLDEFKKWDALPEKVSAATWSILSKLGDGADKFKAFLTALADNDPKSRAAAFASALQEATFGDSAAGQWLAALADQGLLALSSELDKVQPVAAQTLDILNGGIIRRLQSFFLLHCHSLVCAIHPCHQSQSPRQLRNHPPQSRQPAIPDSHRGLLSEGRQTVRSLGQTNLRRLPCRRPYRRFQFARPPERPLPGSPHDRSRHAQRRPRSGAPPLRPALFQRI